MGRRADNFLLVSFENFVLDNIYNLLPFGHCQEEDDLTDDASLSADSAEHQSQEPRSGSRESNAQPLKSFMSSLVEIPKFIQDSVLFYERKLRKRVK